MWKSLVPLTVAALLLTACAGGGNGAGSDDGDPADAQTISKKFSGTTIRLLVPEWADMGEEKYAEFTELTGIKVVADVQEFDQTHHKAVTGMQSGSAPADVVELDWGWVTQYGSAKWMTPLEEYIRPEVLQDVSAKKIFQFDGKQIGVPYALDFRWIKVNMTLFKQAGIETPPSSWKELLEDAKQIKAKGVVEFPLGMPLKVVTETPEAWFTLTKMAGGDLLDENSKPVFDDPNSPAYQAMEFLEQAGKAGLIDPSNSSVSGQKVRRDFGAGNTAVDLANGPPSTYRDADSKVANDELVDIVIAQDGPGDQVFGVPESFGIPASSKNKVAAAMFLNWYHQIDNQVFMYTNQAPSGVFPVQPEAVKELDAQGKLDDAEMLKKMVPHVVPLFEHGTPTWFTTFSNDAAAAIQAVVLGKQTTAAAMKDLAKKVESY